jgi:hypothetical protein
MKKITAFAALAAALTVTSAQATPTYLPVGAQSNVSLATITGGGWTQCYSAAFATTIGNNGETVLNQCTDTYLMMAGRETGSSNFLALAAALRSDAITDTGSGTQVTHVANGASWYYSSNWSWGFTALGDAVELNSCDYGNSSPLSICLHTQSLYGGYRINDLVGLNDSTAYEKVFFQASADGNVPVPGSIALLGLGLVGLSIAQRRSSASKTI